MAFRDSWHRALVYFGLAEEYHEEYEDEAPPEAAIEDRYRERPNVRRLRRRRDDYDEIFAEDEPSAAGGVDRRGVRRLCCAPSARAPTATCACTL